MNDDETWSVGQLQRKAKNALAREMRGQVWVVGEIRSMREHRGSVYLTLAEPGEHADGGDVSVDVAAWAKRAAVIKAQLTAIGIVLAAGMEVRVCGNVTLSKVGRLQIELSALDVEALAGRVALGKRKLYETLRSEGLLDANRLLPTPAVPLRIGLVTSDGSEGCRDFLGQLERSNYAFAVTLAHTAVQGPAAPPSIARAVSSLADVELIAVVRGGGGELEAFDKEPVARAIASAAVPVWTGIGHTGDKSVADDVSARCFITPTACGQAVVAVVDAYFESIHSALSRLHRLALRTLNDEHANIRRRSSTLGSCVQRQTTHRQRDVAEHSRDLCRIAAAAPDLAHERLTTTATRLGLLSHKALDHNETRLSYLRGHIGALDPERPLKRGYSLTYTPDGKVVTDASRLVSGDMIVTKLARGAVRSKVEPGNGE